MPRSLRKNTPVSGIALTLLATLFGSAPSHGQTVDPDLWVAKEVRAVARDGNTIYIGGAFDYVGPPNGRAVALDAVTGAVTRAPKPNGDVYAVAPDGTGGWYIAGAFTHVGGVPRGRLARIAADGSLSAWNPDADNRVWALAIVGSTVYIGGDFTTVGGQARTRIAQLDAGTGIATAWDKSANATVHQLVPHGTILYVSGLFGSLAGVARNCIGAIDMSTGEATSWNPSANSIVYSIAVSDTLVYAGGTFTSIGGFPRNRVAAVGISSGVATAWNPNADGVVWAVAPDGGSVYVGGIFNNIGGAARSRVAKIDAATGLATVWNPALTGGVLRAIHRSGSTVRLGGAFLAPRRALAEVDTTTGAVTSWDPKVSQSGQVYALAHEGSTIYAGGDFISVGGVTRNQIAALDATTGEATSWAPTALGGTTATAIVVGESHHVYVGNGATSSSVRKLDPVTGAVVWTSAGTGGSVEAMALRGSTLYVGGNFTSWASAARNRLVALDANTGARLAWDPNANGTVSAIAVADTVVYIGGTFTNVRTLPRSRLAAIRAVSDSLMPWDPGTSGVVRALATRGTDVYVGGAFGSVGGSPRSAIAALDATTGLANAFDPVADDTVRAIAVTNAAVYAAGRFSVIGGESRQAVVELDPASGAATPWNARVLNDDAGTTVGQCLSVGGGTVLLGGVYEGIGETGHAGLARVFAPVTESFGSVWHADFGVTPDAQCPWSLYDTADPEAPVLGSEVLTLSTSTATENQYFEQTAALSIPDTLRISARLRVVDETHIEGNPRRGVQIGFTVSADRANILQIGRDTVFLWSAFGVQGPTALVDTDDSLHTYDIVVKGPTAVEVFQDNTLILTGSVTDHTGYADAPNLYWGDGTGAASATSEWEYFLHNASTLQCGAGIVGAPWQQVDVGSGPLISLTSYPNPSRGPLTVAILSMTAGLKPSRLKIYDVAGRFVRSLEAGALTQGRTLVRWDGKDAGGRTVSTGTYFVRLETSGKSFGSQKVTLLR